MNTDPTSERIPPGLLSALQPTGHPAGDSADNPTAQRILLGAQLRRLRETAGKSRGDAANAIRATQSKISRLELGRSSFKQRDVADLLTCYSITDSHKREALLNLARRASSPGWWHQYSDVIPHWLELYVGLEEAAWLIRTYEVQFVHGLMQTEEYARAVITLRHARSPAHEIDQRIALRMRRQQILHRPDGPRLWAVLDEAALRRPLGTRQVMRAQLEHLIKLIELRQVTLQIVPFHVGGHAAAGGPFTLLRFPALDLPDLVYLEQLNSALYLDKVADIDDYTQTMDQLCVEAQPPDRTHELLTAILADT
jgi:hypothetical protein